MNWCGPCCLLAWSRLCPFSRVFAIRTPMQPESGDAIVSPDVALIERQFIRAFAMQLNHLPPLGVCFIR
uniref:Putative secreted protein n=1 Tax=Anopheles marajoara TaxID=58244 RepID=A0A2M4CET5_9DIPT